MRVPAEPWRCRRPGSGTQLRRTTTRVGAHDEVLEDEVNCLLVPPGDVTALAAALRRLIDDEGLRSRLGQAARRLYETDFSMTRYLHRLEALDAKAIPQPPLFGKLP